MTITSYIKSEWSDFATSILKSWFKKLRNEQCVGRIPLNRAFLPALLIYCGERHSSCASPHSCYALLIPFEECSILWHEQQREETEVPLIHPGTLQRINAHFWATHSFPSEVLGLGVFSETGPLGVVGEKTNPWNIFWSSGPQASPSERFSYHELTLLSRDPAGPPRSVGPYAPPAAWMTDELDNREHV